MGVTLYQVGVALLVVAIVCGLIGWLSSRRDGFDGQWTGSGMYTFYDDQGKARRSEYAYDSYAASIICKTNDCVAYRRSQ